jgi:hypothetical protein
MIELMPHQLQAIELLGSGKILWGGVGVGKSATVLGYYMKKEAPRPIFVITTAKKRDSLDWEVEAQKFGIGTEKSLAGLLKVDSWNNIYKYLDIEDAFFIFDEQRLVSNGSWVKSFIKIARENHWVLLSATPGDTWLDYAPVFIANGFYRNITDFKRRHVLYEPFVKYPKVKAYLNQTKLHLMRDEILVEMPYLSSSKRYLNYLLMGYDKNLYRTVFKNRWNPWEDRPIKDASELFRLMRRVSNSHPSRLEMVRELLKIHPKLIIFYNFNYELDILRGLNDEILVAEWNGKRKDPLPEGDNWVYLVQYLAGSEAWECTSTDAMVLYSLTYSYKNFIQAQGRIDRLNAAYLKLYYYVFVSGLKIDREIKRALQEKRNFNEKRWGEKVEYFEDEE